MSMMRGIVMLRVARNFERKSNDVEARRAVNTNEHDDEMLFLTHDFNVSRINTVAVGTGDHVLVTLSDRL